VPTDVAKRCRTLVERFGLRFGAVDLAVGSDGVYWFLELNPNGEWGWLQRAGLPIAEALADTLLHPQSNECA
jgi:glutathione synthase/RimK-type ligase-like ATP-grasp enzyme